MGQRAKLEGYREGVLHGQESVLQSHFDSGYSQALAVSSRIARARGAAAAKMFIHSADEGKVSKLKNCLSDLSKLESVMKGNSSYSETELESTLVDGVSFKEIQDSLESL